MVPVVGEKLSKSFISPLLYRIIDEVTQQGINLSFDSRAISEKLRSYTDIIVKLMPPLKARARWRLDDLLRENDEKTLYMELTGCTQEEYKNDLDRLYHGGIHEKMLSIVEERLQQRDQKDEYTLRRDPPQAIYIDNSDTGIQKSVDHIFEFVKKEFLLREIDRETHKALTGDVNQALTSIINISSMGQVAIKDQVKYKEAGHSGLIIATERIVSHVKSSLIRIYLECPSDDIS